MSGTVRRGTRIEIRRGAGRRVILLTALGYAALFVPLFLASSSLAYLPAGLRLASLWLLPRRTWWTLAVTEWFTLLALHLYRDSIHEPAALVLATLGPWCLYALTVRLLAVTPTPAPTPRTIYRYLLCGLVASLANGLLQGSVHWLDRVGTGADVPPLAADFVLGDFLGVMLVAPVLRLLHVQTTGARVPWPSLLANGMVFMPVAVMAFFSLPSFRSAMVYPLLFSAVPLLFVAFRHGWRASTVAMVLLGCTAYFLRDSLWLRWTHGQAQLLLAVIAFGGLALGVATDALRTQGRALQQGIELLSVRTRALADATNRVVSQQEDERRRIGSDLHDQLGQDMTAIATRLRLVERITTDAVTRGHLRSVLALVNDAHEHLRDVILSLHPLVVDRFGLARALEAGPLLDLARDHDIDYRCAVEGPVELLPRDVGTSLYRICQEVTTNAVRHGCGGVLHLRLSLLPREDGHHLELAILDEAGAFEMPTGNLGSGLQNIQDRADAMGADYTFNPSSGHPRHVLRLQVPGIAGGAR